MANITQKYTPNQEFKLYTYSQLTDQMNSNSNTWSWNKRSLTGFVVGDQDYEFGDWITLTGDTAEISGRWELNRSDGSGRYVKLYLEADSGIQLSVKIHTKNTELPLANSDNPYIKDYIFTVDGTNAISSTDKFFYNTSISIDIIQEDGIVYSLKGHQKNSKSEVMDLSVKQIAINSENGVDDTCIGYAIVNTVNGGNNSYATPLSVFATQQKIALYVENTNTLNQTHPVL